MRLVNLLAALRAGSGWFLRTGLAAALGPPDPGRNKKSPIRWPTLFVEPLEARDTPAASFLSLTGLTAVTAIDVLDNGTVEAVGYKTDATTGLSLGAFATISTSGQIALQPLAGLPGFGNPNVMPLDINNGRAVGVEVGVSPSTGQASRRAVAWNLTDPTTVFDLGSAGANDFNEADSVNAAGVWVGTSNGTLLAVYGQLFGQTTPTILSTLANGSASADAIAEDGTKVVTVGSGNEIGVRVYRPDNTSFVTLANPFASEGSTVMFGWHISEDGTKVLCNAQRFNPVTETWDMVAVVFTGPNWSQWTTAALSDGISFFGTGADVENSGTVTIAASDGVYFWNSATPGAVPQKVDSTMLGTAVPQNVAFSIVNRSGNPTVEKGGATFLGVTGTSGAYLVEIGTFADTPPVSTPVTVVAARNGTTVVDVSKYPDASSLIIDASATSNRFSVVNVVGKAAGPLTVVVNGGAGVNLVYFATTGPVTAQVNLGGGNDFFDGNRSTAVLNVHGGAGNDILIGNRVAGSTLYGDNGNDLLVAHGNTTIHTGNGIDILVVDGGHNTIDVEGFWDIALVGRDDTSFGRPWLPIRRWRF